MNPKLINHDRIAGVDYRRAARVTVRSLVMGAPTFDFILYGIDPHVLYLIPTRPTKELVGARPIRLALQRRGLDPDWYVVNMMEIGVP